MDVSNNPKTVSILYQFPVRAGLDGVVRGQVGSVTAFRNAITAAVLIGSQSGESNTKDATCPLADDRRV